MSETIFEEIENRWSYGTGIELDWNQAKEDVDWLIQRVKELEEMAKIDAEEITFWKEAFKIGRTVFEDKVKSLEADLSLNKSMLAKQCDLAREAETNLSKAQERIKDLETANDIWKRQNATLFNDTVFSQARVRDLEEGLRELYNADRMESKKDYYEAIEKLLKLIEK